MDNKEEEMCIMKASKGSHLLQRKTDKVQDSFNKKTSKGSVPRNSNWTIPNEKEYNSHKQEYTSHIGHAKIMFQKPNDTNTHPEDLIFCEEEISSLEQVTGNSCSQIDHDLIGFYRKKKKKELGNQKSHKLSVEKLDRLKSIEARLKFLESCTLHACNTLDAVEDESLCSAQILSEEVEENKQNHIRKKLSDQSEKGIVDNVGQVMEDSEKALKDFKHPSAFHTSNEAAKVQENNLSAKDSVYTQTDMFEGSSTGATCIEVKDKSTDAYSAELKERNNNCIGLQTEEESSKQKETPVETLIEHQRISELEAEMKEKDAEILRYKEGIMKMEEMMKVNGSLDSALHHERLLEVVVTAKKEILSLKETLDAMKHAKQVAETSLRDIVSERNQLRQALSKLSKSAHIKIQHLNAELETCKDRELTSREEIKTLSSLLNLERIDFQRQLNESKLFSISQLPQVFFLGLNSREGTLAYQHALVGQEGRVIDSENTWRTFEDSKEPALSRQIKEIAELKKELENMRVQSMKSEQLTIEVEMLRKKLEEAENHIADNMQKRIDFLTYENDKLLEQNKILSSNLSENNKLLEENKNLSSMLSENAQKVVATEDALRIKNKMLDSQNDSIRDLKSEIVALKKCITDKAAAMETMERNLTRKLDEERDKVHELQNELAEEEIIFSQIEEELKREKKANVEAEIAKSSLLTKLNEKDKLLKFVESKIEHANQLYESREKAVIHDKDKALENLQLVIREKTALQSQCEGLIAEKKALEEREQKLMESLAQQSKESLELSEKLLAATASLNAQTVAQAKMKDAYSYKVNQLSKVLEELQDVNIS